MELRLIRSATLRLTYGGRRVPIDPYLAPKHSRPSYSGRSPNPLVDLPVSPDEALKGVELAIVSHLHSDHFDALARERLPKALPLLCQPEDEDVLRGLGFTQVRPLMADLTWQGITLTRVIGQHGSGAILREMGPAMGIVLQGAGEPIVYWTGDTILTPNVLDTIARVRPGVIVTHSCGAVWGEGTLIVMDATQTVAVCTAAPEAVVVATHMEALDHATVSRIELRRTARSAGIADERLRIPRDGETLTFSRASPSRGPDG